jgi:hypothetical protein
MLSVKGMFTMRVHPSMLACLTRQNLHAVVVVGGPILGNWCPDDMSILECTVLISRCSRQVITVPAHFNSAQREATREAAHLAGIAQVEILQGVPAGQFHHF